MLSSPYRSYFVGLLIFLVSSGLLAAVQRDVEYGRAGGVRLLLDANIPEGPGPFPAAVIVHGGAWNSGSKEKPAHILFPLLERAGVASFSIDYRLAPAHPYPAAVEDIQQSIGFLREHSGKFRIRKDLIFLIGESAGGHLASLVGARYGEKVGLSGVISFYGRVDLAKGAGAPGAARQAIEKFLNIDATDTGSLALQREASPIHWVRAGLPPFLALHGTGDSVVPYTESVDMCEAIRNAKGDCEVFLIPGAAHGLSNWEADPSQRIYRYKLTAWLGKRLLSRPPATAEEK